MSQGSGDGKGDALAMLLGALVAFIAMPYCVALIWELVFH